MRSQITRVAVATLAAVLAAGTLGCGLLSKAKDVADTAKVAGDLSKRVGRSATLTFTAEYSMTGGKPITVAQQPPNSALVTSDSRYVTTKEAVFMCTTKRPAVTCQKSPNTAADQAQPNASLLTSIAGTAFISPELGIAEVVASVTVPGASVSESTKTFAGQSALCATVTGLESAAATPGDNDTPHDVTVCITDNGILGLYSATDAKGTKTTIELTRYVTTADPSLFGPPPGAAIVDVGQLPTS